MMLDKKQIWAIFLFEFKMGYKAAEITCNINNAFGPGTGNKWTVRWWFKKFCKGDKSLEDEEHSGWPSEVDHDQLRAIIKVYNYMRSFQRTEHQSIYDCSAFEANWKGEKAQKWVPLELIENLKKQNNVLKCSSLILCNKNEPFLNRIVMYDEKWILYNWQ